MKKLHSQDQASAEPILLSVSEVSSPLTLPLTLDAGTQVTLERMFRDPRVLDSGERTNLVASLQNAVKLSPHVPELRVVLGMALCVDLKVQEALEELRESVRQAPNSFIARLKFGELLMRLRVCSKAEEETMQAAQLAINAVQSELARRQAAAIRAMLRDGVERGGYTSILSRIFRFRRKPGTQSNAPVLIHPR